MAIFIALTLVLGLLGPKVVFGAPGPSIVVTAPDPIVITIPDPIVIVNTENKDGTTTVVDTTKDDTTQIITVPTSTIQVIKIVINDSGRTKTVADFPLFVNGVLVISNVANILPAGVVYTVTETNNTSEYTSSFSGDCNSEGQLDLNIGGNKVCTITNDDTAIVTPPSPDPVVTTTEVKNFTAKDSATTSISTSNPTITIPIFIPVLPDTGFSPDIPWYLIFPVGIITLFFIIFRGTKLLVVKNKK